MPLQPSLDTPSARFDTSLFRAKVRATPVTHADDEARLRGVRAVCRVRPCRRAPTRIPREADDESRGRPARTKARHPRHRISRGLDGRHWGWRRRVRLQLIAAIAMWSATAHAQVADQEPGTGDVKSSLAMYADSDKTTVVTS